MKFSLSNMFTKPKVKFSDPLAPTQPDEMRSLTPAAMVIKRFIRNRLAIVGLLILVFMFAFSFLGGFLSPYGESQVFEGANTVHREYASVFSNTEFKFISDGDVPAVLKSRFLLALGKKEDVFKVDNTDYKITILSNDIYELSVKDDLKIIASKYIIDSSEILDFHFITEAYRAFSSLTNTFTADNNTYTILYEDKNAIISKDAREIAAISKLIIKPLDSSEALDNKLKMIIMESIADDVNEFTFDFGSGDERLSISKSGDSYKISRNTQTQLIRIYEAPSGAHWLGTDANGMDILTRLMYGGRISLLIGFVVIVIEIFIGVLLGGIAGYFGKITDNIIMRIVDIFNCIPTWPIIIIFGALMDAMRVDAKSRIYFMMLILGLLGWPSMARIIRAQILSLREQEFMIAAEATGLSVSRRIFRHLVPNVIPQLIVMATMGLGSIILTESTLSFLGLGVKFPYASWGNIIQSVSSVHVMTNYWFVWIPAGFLILITVLGFNFAGDGLRDAFDPRMKR